MKELTREYLQGTKGTYERNEQRAWAMFKDATDDVIKRSLEYQAHKTHGMAIAVAKMAEAESITLDLLYEVKNAYEAAEKSLELDGRENDAAEARGSKEAIEELVFVMTGSFPEMK